MVRRRRDGYTWHQDGRPDRRSTSRVCCVQRPMWRPFGRAQPCKKELSTVIGGGGGGLLLFHLHLHLQLLLLLLLLNDGRGLHFPRSSPSSGRKNNPSVKCDPSLGVIFRGPQQHAPQIFHVPSLTESISIQSRISYHFFHQREDDIRLESSDDEVRPQ